MTCAICIDFGKTNTFTKGCSRRRIDVLNEHVDSSNHREAVSDQIECKKSKELFNKVLEKKESHNFIMLKISHFISKFNLSFNTYPVLCELIFRDVFKIMGVNIKNDTNYENDKMCKQYIESISYIIEDKLILKAIKSPFYSLLFDESMDTSKIEQLIIYIKYYDEKNKKFVTTFLKILELEKQEGAYIYVKIRDLLQSVGLDLQKCMSIGTDGAHNMTGTKKGVFACFRNANPFLVNIHCANHRLALASSDTTKQLNFLKEYIDNISDIYAFFSRSSKRNVLLRKYQLETCEPHLNVLRMCDTRWLSLSHCVKNIRRTYGSIILAITEEFTEIVPTTEKAKKDEERLRKLLDSICSYKFIAFTHYLSDILQIIENLSLQFQKENTNYATFFNAIDVCMSEIKENYIDKILYGENYQSFLKEYKDNKYLPSIIIEFTSIMEKEVGDNMKEFSLFYFENIKERFAYQDIVVWMQILNLQNILDLDEHEYVNYGRDELDKLIEFYGNEKKFNNLTTPAFINSNDIKGEFRLFKRMVRKNCSKMTNDDLWIYMTEESQRSLYPNIYKLGMVANLLPVSTAICERGFSTMKIIKRDVRSKLGIFP